MCQSLYLCIFCRKSGHETQFCPRWAATPGKQPESSFFDEAAETDLIKALRNEDDYLCERCAKFDILNVFATARPLNEQDRDDYIIRNTRGIGVAEMKEMFVRESKKGLSLGNLHRIQLRVNCPLCRLIFEIFPKDAIPPGVQFTDIQHLNPKGVWLKPFWSYDQILIASPVRRDFKSSYALYFAIEVSIEGPGNFFVKKLQGRANRVLDAISLATFDAPASRPALNARPVPSLINYDLLRNWVDGCIAHHGPGCRNSWSEKLLSSRVIDILSRRVVPYPAHCEYVALSYVWGEVKPEDVSLKFEKLPQTIEDAIKVTKGLGKQYLWVDALCVDQTPTDSQAYQLKIMDIIYSNAYATIVALHGDNGNAGLPGVSMNNLRISQGKEKINGKTLLTILPTIEHEFSLSRWMSRAWTYQEGFLSCRRIIFTKHQVYFACNTAHYSESIDEHLDPDRVLQDFHPEVFNPDLDYRQAETLIAPTDKLKLGKSPPSCTNIKSLEDRLRIGSADFEMFLDEYTNRQMSYEHDSLNACLGILSRLCSFYPPMDFIWGMPLQNFPNSLRWFHGRNVKPKRRLGFPSWSWAGWEGQVRYSSPLSLQEQRRVLEPTSDLTVRVLGVEDKIIVIESTTVTLEIKADPFTEAYVPGTEYLLGCIGERDFLHNNTLRPGIYDFLIVERLKYKVTPDSPFRYRYYMLLIKKIEDVEYRVTKVRLYLELDADFDNAKPKRRHVRLG
ncbi:MAG: hypothetical protein M1834_006752 [Cirrosporium novae-zelandiae]|nr:MAG: hypothetical protein M1834_006752 [Cirrosporium novae-zelandiae]